MEEENIEGIRDLAVSEYKEEQRNLITIDQFKKNKAEFEHTIRNLIKDFEEKNPTTFVTAQVREEYNYCLFTYKNNF